MARPGSALELQGEMLPHERRFLAWLNSSGSLSSDRERLARRIGLNTADPMNADRRMLDTYKKFRDIWGVLESYHEGFGPDGEHVDRFVPSGDRLSADLAFVKARGINAVVSLTERPLDGEALAEHGLSSLHLPVADKAAPDPGQVDAFVGYLDEEIGRGGCVLVHCLGGYGRTGTLAACYLVHCGMSAREAIDGLRERRPGSIENEVQEGAVIGFEERSG
jgi:atypical dual specificity phosphatase